MKLKSVKIHDYKCFVETNEVEIAKDVTCLVGVNETGKSLFLEALAKTENYDGIDSLNKSSNKTITSLDNKFCTLKWALEDNDINAINVYYSYYADHYNDIITNHYYGKRTQLINFISRQQYLEYISNKLNVNIASDLNNLDTFMEVVGKHVNFDMTPYASRSNGSISEFLSEFLDNYQPRFLLFTNQSLIRKEVKLSSIYDETDQSLISKILVQNGLTKDIIASLNNSTDNEYQFKRIKHKSESFCNDLLRRYWPNKSIDFRFDLRINHSSGNIFSGRSVIVSIYDEKLISPVEFNDRSLGLQTYVSLMLSIAYEKETHLKQYPLIVLLDEPDCHLHPGAQQNMLNFVYNDLIKSEFIDQIIYSTHSPFMINSDFINDVRIFNNTSDNIQVSDIIHEKDEISLAPLRAALGYDLTKCLFIGSNYLLVEGWSDELYIKEMKTIVDGKYKLHDKWIILPTQGTPDIIRVYRILKSQGFNTVILRDFKKNEQKAIEDEIDKNNADIKDELRQRVIYYKDFIKGLAEAEVEDMFSMKNYYKILSEIRPEIKNHEGELISKKTFDSFKGFVQTNCSIKICHSDPAKHLRDNGFDHFNFEDSEIVKENFAQLFDRVNSFLG